MKILNRDITRAELERHIGSLGQIGGTRHYELADGRSRGMRAVDFELGAGFRFTVLPERGMDISLATFNGINLVHQTCAGEVHPAFYDARHLEWLRNFFAGLLTTCGLTTLGGPGRDGDEELGLHGRYANTPARQVADLSGWEGDDYVLRLRGVVEEGALFLDKLRLTRTITARLGARALQIHDRIENFGSRPSPLTILYHVNAGFPLLDAGSELHVSATECEPFDEVSRAAMNGRFGFQAPEAGFVEQNFLYRPQACADGRARAALINRGLAGGLGLYLAFRPEELPYFNEWKMLGAGDYVVGIEPCSVPCENRGSLRRRGMLPFLEPGEVKEITLEIGVLAGLEEIGKFVDHFGPK